MIDMNNDLPFNEELEAEAHARSLEDALEEKKQYEEWLAQNSPAPADEPAVEPAAEPSDDVQADAEKNGGLKQKVFVVEHGETKYLVRAKTSAGASKALFQHLFGSMKSSAHVASQDELIEIVSSGGRVIEGVAGAEE